MYEIVCMYVCNVCDVCMYVCMYVGMHVCTIHSRLKVYTPCYVELNYLVVFFRCLPAARFVQSEPEEKKEVCNGTFRIFGNVIDAGVFNMLC